jgi:hypothetical protein
MRSSVGFLVAVAILAGGWVGTILIFRGTDYFAQTPSFHVEAPDTAVLAGGFQSFLDTETSLQRLAAKGVTWELLRDEEDIVGFTGTAIRLQVFRAERFTDRDTEGSLTLTFLNNRLMTTHFDPPDLGRYLKKLEAEGIILDNRTPASSLGRGVQIGQYTKIQLSYAGNGAVGTTWWDTRLLREYQIYMAKVGISQTNPETIRSQASG